MKSVVCHCNTRWLVARTIWLLSLTAIRLLSKGETIRERNLLGNVLKIPENF
jgi:hypothetical protein